MRIEEKLEDKKKEEIKPMELFKYDRVKNLFLKDLINEKTDIKVDKLLNYSVSDGIEALVKMFYINMKGDKYFVLQRTTIDKDEPRNEYGHPAFICDIWQFKDDFNKGSALNFIKEFDDMVREKELKNKNENKKSGKEGGKRMENNINSLKCMKYERIDSDNIIGLINRDLEVQSIEDLTKRVSHSKQGSASKYIYKDKKGNNIYFIERLEPYSLENVKGLGYITKFKTEMWQFNKDFTVQDADNFIKQFDSKKDNVQEISKQKGIRR
jgi:hypothetical protein